MEKQSTAEFLAAKQALHIEISLSHRQLAPSGVFGNTETCRDMQEHAETFRGIKGHAGNTRELRGIQGNTREL